jgi:hypothetical protein
MLQVGKGHVVEEEERECGQIRRKWSGRSAIVLRRSGVIIGSTVV